MSSFGRRRGGVATCLASWRSGSAGGSGLGAVAIGWGGWGELGRDTELAKEWDDESVEIAASGVRERDEHLITILHRQSRKLSSDVTLAADPVGERHRRRDTGKHAYDHQADERERLQSLPERRGIDFRIR